jgi:hypothetical protein
MKTKSCPIKVAASFAAPMDSHFTAGAYDCMEGRCGWWDGKRKRCAVVSLSALSMIAEGMVRMVILQQGEER